MAVSNGDQTDDGDRAAEGRERSRTHPAIRLYGIPLSHPVAAARMMLQYKGLAFRETLFPSGLHRIGLRLTGFRGKTVPVLRVDGRRIEGSLRIARALEDLQPRPMLFPHDPESRRRVEEAESWSDDELQEPARRLMRWAVTRHVHLRRQLARLNRLPFVRAAAILLRPLAAHFARLSRADDVQVREDLRRLSTRIRQVDRWISEGRVGTSVPNAADFQIATSLRLLLAFDDLADAFAGTEARRLALRYQPDFPVDVGRVFPAEWLEEAGLRGRVARR